MPTTTTAGLIRITCLVISSSFPLLLVQNSSTAYSVPQYHPVRKSKDGSFVFRIHMYNSITMLIPRGMYRVGMHLCERRDGLHRVRIMTLARKTESYSVLPSVRGLMLLTGCDMTRV